jgi:hypothetical protein
MLAGVKRAVRAFAFLLILFSLSAARATAQSEATTGVIRGTVADSSGAVLPGAMVEIRNVETSIVREVVTDEGGRFHAPLLRLGSYSVTVRMPGFATLVREGLRLGIGETVVLDLRMELAGLTDTVTISAAPPLIDAARTELTTTVNAQAIQSLPINGRNFTDFAALTPAAQGNVGPGGRGLSIGGQQSVTTFLAIDGADRTDSFRGGALAGQRPPYTFSQEAVQEFQVLRSGYSAEFGRSSGGMVNVVTRSGSNEFHGSGFVYVKDDALVANDGLDRPPKEFSQQQFGGSAGGPVRRNRAFFFLAYDQQDFDKPLYIDVQGQLPEFAAEQGTFKSTSDARTAFAKLDYQLTGSTQIVFRYNYSDHTAESGENENPNFGISTNGTSYNSTHSGVATLSSVLSSSMLNELRIQYAAEDRTTTANDPVGPNIQIGSFQVGRAINLPVPFTNTDRLQLQNNFSYVRGRLSLKTGIDVNFNRMEQIFIGFAGGKYTFASPASFRARQPILFQQFFGLGGRTAEEAGTTKFSQGEVAAFVQHAFRLRPAVTINAGLRWEALFNPDPAEVNPLFPLTGQVPDDTNNVAPRVGVSWQPDRRTVVRAGGGLFFGRTQSILLIRAFDTNGLRGAQLQVRPGAPYFPTFPAVLPAFPAQAALPPLRINYTAPDFQVPRTLQYSLAFEREIAADLSLGLELLYSNTVNVPRTRDVNLFPAVATSAEGRPLYDPSVRPNPNFAQIVQFESSAMAVYHALILELRKRFSHGVQFGASYTYSRNRDSHSEENTIFGPFPQDNFDLASEWATSSRDVPHRFVGYLVWMLRGGIKVSSIVIWESGRPYTATLSTDANRDTFLSDRPYENGRSVPRNTYRQPNAANTDVRVSKIFSLGKTGKAEFIFEVFNLFANDNLTTTSTTVGPAFGGLNQAGPPRQVQIGFRYTF